MRADAATACSALSLVADAPRFTLAGAAPEDVVVSADRFEAHLRPNLEPSAGRGFRRGARGRGGASLPAPRRLLRRRRADEPRISTLTATRAEGFAGRPVVGEIERWREAGGKLDILEFSLVKGARRVEAQGRARASTTCTGRPAKSTSRPAGLESLSRNFAGKRPRRHPARRAVRRRPGRRQPGGGAGPYGAAAARASTTAASRSDPSWSRGVRLLPLY